MHVSQNAISHNATELEFIFVGLSSGFQYSSCDIMQSGIN